MVLEVSLEWEKTNNFVFNNVVIQQTSGDQFQLLVGCADGKIRVIKDANEEDILETKGGAIQQLILHDITRFGDDDILSSDAEGNIVLFSNRRILFRSSVGHPVSSLTVASDIRGYRSLIAGDRSGVVTGLQLHHSNSPLFRFFVSSDSLSLSSSSSSSSLFHSSPDLSVRCLLPVIIPPMNSLSKGGIVPHSGDDRLAHYLLVAASTPHIHFYSEGKRVYSLSVPSIVNSMCIGRFTGDSDNKLEIALGCENGFVYILRDFSIHKLFSVGQTISHICALNNDENISSNISSNIKNNNNSNNIQNNSNGNYDPQLSLLICSGHFNALKIYNKSTLIKEIQAEDWVHTFAVKGNTKSATLAVGLANNSIQVYKLYHNT